MAHARILTATLALALSACVSIAPAPVEQHLASRQVFEKNYEIGRTQEAFVGNPIVRVKDYRVSDVVRNTVEVKTDFAFDHVLFSHQFHKGENYPYGGEATFGGRSYHVMKVGHFGIMFGDDGHVLNRIIGGVGQKGMIPMVMIYEFDPVPADARVARIVSQRVDPPGFHRSFELIFSGLTPDSIRIAYREYSPADLAKPALAQDLTYPLHTREIRFRDLDIAVVSASADRLVYRVLADAPATPSN